MKRILLVILALALATPIRGQRADIGVATGQLRGPGGAPAIGVRVAALPVTDTNTQQVGGSLVSLAETGPDGRFRLENIPPGRYYIQAGFIDGPSYYPGVSSTATATSVLVAAGATVTGLDFTMTRGAGVRISGRVPLTINPRPVVVRLIGGNNPIGGPSNFEIGPDGSFEFLRVAPGNYSIAVTPPNSVLPPVQLLVNDKDVQVGMPAGPGFKVSGSVGHGPQSQRSPNQRVVLTGSTAWSQLETPVNTGGEFDFPSVPAGTYTVRTIPGSLSDASKLTVVDREIRGFVIPVLVQLAGQVLLEGGGSLPQSSIALMIEATRADGTVFASAANTQGAFKLPLNEGDYRIAPGKIPSDFRLKSISYGSSNLLTEAVRLDGTTALAEIRLTLEKKP